MKKILFCFFLSLAFKGFAQKTCQDSPIFYGMKATFGLPEFFTSKWELEVANKTSSDHVYNVPKHLILEQKQRLASQREKQIVVNSGTSRSHDAPIIGQNFEGNMSGNNVPPDNSMAISHHGFIVSAINTNVIFTDASGTVKLTKNLADFFSLLELNGPVYDPRILFDVEQRKFILLALNGNTSANTNIVIAFSKTEDPSAGWYYYKIQGNPLKDVHWFDYPNVGLTKQDLFLGGLMRDEDGNWKYTILFQIDKMACFNGSSIAYKYYVDLKNADNTPAFNLVPAHNGWNHYPDQSMHMISNIASGGDAYYLHTVNGSLHNNPQLTSRMAIGLKTELAPDGLQKSGSNVLNTFDSRIWNAVQLGEVIHFGGHVNSPNNTSGLLYGRYDLVKNEVYATVYHHPDFDYGFPSIAAYGSSEESDTVLIHALITGKTLDASQIGITCVGRDAAFDFSNEVFLHKGNGVVNALTGNRERWGDYTTICRRFFGTRPEVWSVGCHAKNSSYGTWIGQFFADTTSTYLDFTASKSTLLIDEFTSFNILFPKKYKNVTWTMDKSSKPISSLPTPVTSYDSLGSYDVTLKIIDVNDQEHSLTKQKFITVIEPVIAPIADFSVDKDTIVQGEYVQMIDKSTNNAINYKWNFFNGIPATSTLKDPIVQYTKVGSHFVSQSVKNTAGSNTVIKQKFITVQPVALPIANFDADQKNTVTNNPVQFMDLSTNYPLKWSWTFEGGQPETSTLQNPTVTYNTAGEYTVSLEVTNAAGKANATKDKFITIGAVNTTEHSWLEGSNIAPNPIQKGNAITLKFNLDKNTPLRIVLNDQHGRSIKILSMDKFKSGENQVSFSSIMLHPGVYYISIISSDGQKTLPFVVVE